MKGSEPIEVRDGKYRFSTEFISDNVFMACLPVMGKDPAKASDLAAYLYNVFSPNSIYRTVPEKERLSAIVRSGLVRSPEVLQEMLSDDRCAELRDHYARLVMLPSERLRLGLVEAVDRLLRELSEIKADSDTDYFLLIEKGKKLHGYAKEIEAMVVSESNRKVRGSYTPQLYERRSSQPQLKDDQAWAHISA